MFSLITEPWLPIIDSQGEYRKISVLNIADNEIIDLAWPRADFQGAAYQMLIGLLQTVFAPVDTEAWESIWDEGIDADKWHQALERVAPAFHFGSGKPAFLQDFDTLNVESSSVSGLLVDAPGGNTIKLNKDHFVKRSHYQRFCPHCTAMALYTVQTNSPAAGVGYRTSMRGGGPMTTLVMPAKQEPLWKKLWLNVLPNKEEWQSEQLPVIFPWLAATKTSDTSRNSVTPENSHLLQAYWGMPRRLEIDFGTTEPGECDLCGETHASLLTRIRSKNYGVQYEGWQHPLTPYRQSLKDLTVPMLPVKGQPGGLAYKDWLGLVASSEDKFNRVLPAHVVQIKTAKNCDIDTQLWCFGYDMDNAKSRCWYEHHLVISTLPEESIQEHRELLQHAIDFSVTCLPLLRQALKEAWFKSPKEVKGDFSMIDIAFWQQTETHFISLWKVLNQFPSPVFPQARHALRQWIHDIENYLFATFDNRALNSTREADAIIRTIKARLALRKNLLKQKSRKKLKEITVEHKEIEHA